MATLAIATIIAAMLFAHLALLHAHVLVIDVILIAKNFSDADVEAKHVSSIYLLKVTYVK